MKFNQILEILDNKGKGLKTWKVHQLRSRVVQKELEKKLAPLKEYIFNEFKNKATKIPYTNNENQRGIMYAYKASNGETFSIQSVEVMLRNAHTMKRVYDIAKDLDITLSTSA